MPPNSSGPVIYRTNISINNRSGILINYRLLELSMRRGGPSGAGSTTPLATQRSEFEDFVNAYRPNLEAGRREPVPPPKPVESKVDFGRSIKKLMKRPTSSPNVPNKNNRKEGFHRTPTLATSRPERERSVSSDARPMSEKKTKRPTSANVDSASLAVPPQTFGPGPSTMILPTAVISMPEVTPPPSPLPSPTSKTPKTSIKLPMVKNGLEDHLKPIQESVPALAVPVIPPVVPLPAPMQVKKKVSIQEDKRRSGTDVSYDAFCLIITSSHIGRYLPLRHNPDPILSMRVIPVPERKYHVVLEFEESPYPTKLPASTSGLMVMAPEENNLSHSKDQLQFFSWIRESHIAATGMLLINVEKITEFPFATYLVVSGDRHALAQKIQFVRGNPTLERNQQQLHFIAGYEENVTISRPPPTTFPEKPSSDKTGFVICLYQVNPGEDGAKFEQNWVMWTGARQLYRTVPDYMGLKRISVHKSILPTNIINYCLMCEFSNIMDHLTDACVIIDHLRARCCGFIGIFRVLDSL